METSSMDSGDGKPIPAERKSKDKRDKPETETQQRSSLDSSVNGGASAYMANEGVTFRGKLIGVETVTESRGNAICEVAMSKLKAAVAVSKQHKKQIMIRLLWDRLEVTDIEKIEEKLYSLPLQEISYVWKDTGENRACGVISAVRETDSANGPVRCSFYAFRTEKPVVPLIQSLKRLFLLKEEERKKTLATVDKGTAEQQKPGATDGKAESKEGQTNTASESTAVPDKVKETEASGDAEKSEVSHPPEAVNQVTDAGKSEAVSDLDLLLDLKWDQTPSTTDDGSGRTVDEIFGFMSLTTPPSLFTENNSTLWGAPAPLVAVSQNPVDSSNAWGFTATPTPQSDTSNIWSQPQPLAPTVSASPYQAAFIHPTTVFTPQPPPRISGSANPFAGTAPAGASHSPGSIRSTASTGPRLANDFFSDLLPSNSLLGNKERPYKDKSEMFAELKLPKPTLGELQNQRQQVPGPAQDGQQHGGTPPSIPPRHPHSDGASASNPFN